MLYSHQQTLEDRLVQLLLQKPSSIKSLHAVVSRQGAISLRAVYKAVDALIEAGVLFKTGKQVWVNQQWASSLRERLAPTLSLLAPGEQIAYTFTSMQHLDVFWKTVVTQLDALESNEGVFFYNPHNFWAYIPELKESEDVYYAQFEKEKKQAFFTVGGATEADKQFKRAHQNEYLQIDVRAISQLGRRDHITVLGDFVITARLSVGLAKTLDELYATGEMIEKLLPRILEAYQKDANVRITFEHNALKAKKLRTILSQSFVILT